MLNNWRDWFNQLIFIGHVSRYRHCYRCLEYGCKQEWKISSHLPVRTVAKHGVLEMWHSREGVQIRKKRWPNEGYQWLSGKHLLYSMAVLKDWLHIGKLTKYLHMLDTFKDIKDSGSSFSRCHTMELPIQKRKITKINLVVWDWNRRYYMNSV